VKTIGLIGGMSWESSAEYYRLVNQMVSERLGSLHSCKCIMYSLDFKDVETLQLSGDWEAAGKLINLAARKLEQAGADCLLICSNTMHKVIDSVTHVTSIPIIHIADVTGDAVVRAGIRHVGLLGTRFTMEEDFFVDRLMQGRDLHVSIPEPAERRMIDAVIYEELCHGDINSESRKGYVRVAERMSGKGTEAVILGCTEIGLLLKPEDVAIPLFDTTAIHARAAVDWALSFG
jgi:aspartate racemase